VADARPTRGNREYEVKLSAWPGFLLPDLEGLDEGLICEPLEPRELDAVYYDTPDLRLARWGVTMRYRSGDGASWTVKLPEGEDGPALVRREMTFPGPAGAPPTAACDLLRAYVRSARLAPVAHLRTRRRGFALRDEEGRRLAEVVDDEVTVLEGRRLAARFREVEVEVDGRAPDRLLGEILARLRDAGAGEPDPTPKVFRALGARASGPPELVAPDVDDDASARDVIRAALARSVTRLLVHDAGVRLGDDPEDVHQARVGTRRLRSDLRTFRPLLVEEWSEALRDELSWLASLLGGVRDADVLTDRLRGRAAELPEVDAAGFAPALRRLAEERESARARLLDGIVTARYVALLDDLVAAAAAPLLRPGATKPALDVLPALAARPWRALRKAVKVLPAEPSDEELHGVRIKAKRARYAVEAVAPVAGKDARRLAEAIAGVQDVLGDHHDAVVAEAWLRQAVAGADALQALALGELVGAERAAAARDRERFRRAWKKANRKKLRAWLA
jgi:CHAD domain-containing protein